MLGGMTGRVAERQRARVAEIVGTAWELAREQGVAVVSLHELARRLGIRQPSLYTYFDSKNALYDAMFADGNRALLCRLDELELPADPVAALKVFLHAFTGFAVADPARCALLFQRPVPGFTPSEESYALARDVLDRATTVMRAAGIEDPAWSRSSPA
jgi:AcrR family transcriptional regulator